MKYQMYSIFDLKVGVYHPPIFFRSPGEAIRSFVGAATEGSSLLSKYPKDFSLHSLGSWDDDTAKYKVLPEPAFIGVLHDLIGYESHDHSVDKAIDKADEIARSANLIETAKKDA